VGPGVKLDEHSDGALEAGHCGTLLVQLPSHHTGGGALALTLENADSIVDFGRSAGTMTEVWCNLHSAIGLSLCSRVDQEAGTG
jgi:hypothetical protein